MPEPFTPLQTKNGWSGLAGAALARRAGIVRIGENRPLRVFDNAVHFITSRLINAANSVGVTPLGSVTKTRSVD